MLIIHTILNINVLNVMKDPQRDQRYAHIDAVEPNSIKQGVSRSALSRFLNIPLETIRRRTDRLKKQGILEERADGLIITEDNRYRFGNNHELQKANLVFVRKLLRDLARAGVCSADDL